MAAFHAPTLASETIAHIGSFPIRNSMVMAWMAMAILIVCALVYRSKSKNLVPRGFQNFFEAVIELLFVFFTSITQDPKITKRFFPVVATIFLFVITSNWLGIFPGVGSIGIYEKEETNEVTVCGAAGSTNAKCTPDFEEIPQASEVAVDHEATPSATPPITSAVPAPSQEVILPEATATATATATVTPIEATLPHEVTTEPESPEPSKHEGEVFVPLLRTGYADVNMTLALALISVIMTQVYGMAYLGFFGYAGKFFVNPFKDFVGSFVGILELVSEVAKLISFTFRLFGNIFAGEVLLVVISFLSPYLAPIPFFGLEIFVGFVQALVFSLLTLVFMKMATTSHAEHA